MGLAQGAGVGVIGRTASARVLAGFVGGLLLVTAIPPASSGTAQGRSFLLVVAGIGGDAEHRERFAGLAASLARAATERHGLGAEQVITLVERVELAPDVADGRSGREEIETAFRELAERSRPGDQVVVVLVGHGSSRGGESRFNIPGPDMGPEDFAALLDLLQGRLLALVNTTSSSAPFLPALSGPERVVVTATRSARERDEAVFGRFFVEAFTSADSDLDKDGRVSVLEAFRYADREVARHYEGDDRLRTEHALLDDDGDGEGTESPDPLAGEGALAARIGLGGPVVEPATSGDGEVDPELRRLREERAGVQAQLDALRARREAMEEEEYLARLEELLLDLSRIDERIREVTGEEGRP